MVGSDTVVLTPDGREVRGRSYPWGVIEVDNEEHCDFVKLRQMLVRTYMEELREYTNDVLYENWRTEKLLSMGVAQDSSVFKEVKYAALISSPSFVSYTCCHSPALRMQEERVLHEAKLAKMEAEMKMVFQQKVQEKEAKLKQSEEELYARHREMKESLEKQRLDLEEKKRKIENGRPLTPEKGTVRDDFLLVQLSRLTRDHFSSRKQGRVSSVLEPSVHCFVFPFIGKIFCHPCLPFHGVSTALCATLSNSGILRSALYFVYCVPALVRLAPVTLVCTDIPGMFRHSFPLV